MPRRITGSETTAGLKAYADIVLKEGHLSQRTEVRQCQTSEAREKVDYVVHHGAWDRSKRVFLEGAALYENEDEACEWARSSVAGLSGLLAEADEDERRRLIDEIGAIWVERRVTTTQTIGFVDLPAER